jgi:hypothetical protein
MWFDGKAFGDSHKFITHIDTPSFEAVNSTGEDRLVRATMGMRTKAHILNTHGANAPALYKLNPISKLVLGMEVDSAIPSQAIARVASLSTALIQPGLTGASSTTLNAAMLYVNTNRQLTGVATNGNTVIFNSGWESAPAPLPSTTINNFMFFVNGVLIERSAIISFTDSGLVSTLVVSTANLGYSFKSGDEVVGIGKFIEQDSLS